MWWITSFFLDDIGWCDGLLKILIIQFSRHVVESYYAIIVYPSLHHSISILCLLSWFVLHKEITGIGADVFLVFSYEPVMHNGTVFTTTGQEILFVVDNLFLCHVFCHIGSYRIDYSDESGSTRWITTDFIHWEVGSFVLKHVYSSKGGGLGLSCCLGLSHNIISVATIT